MKARQLIGQSLYHAETDTDAGQVVDLAIEPGGKPVLHLLADIAAPEGLTPVLFTGGLIRVENGRLCLDLSEGELSERVATAREDAPPPHPDASALPPLLIGPFGHSIAPAMMAALISERAMPSPRPDLPRDAAVWLSHMEGQPVFDMSGELGTFEDVEIDTARFICTDIAIQQPDKSRRTLPFEAMRPLPEHETHIVVKGEDGPLKPV
jgi:sporulation protein YlmC with PRC-barrel domain